MEASAESLSVDPMANATDPSATVTDTLGYETNVTDPSATVTDMVGDETQSNNASPKATMRLTAQDAKTPEQKARYRLQEAQLSVPRHRDALRRAIAEGERQDLPDEELAGAIAMLKEEDAKYEAYAHVRSAMANEDLDDLRQAIQDGIRAGLGTEELGPAISMLSNDDFLLARIKKFNTTLEIQHGSPGARDRAKVADAARQKLNASQSLPDLRSTHTSESQPSPGKQAPKERFEEKAEEEDGRLGFTPAWASLPLLVKVVEPKTWASSKVIRVGPTGETVEVERVKVGDEIESVNGTRVCELDKASIMQSLKERPVSITFAREKDNTEVVINQIKEHMEKTYGKKALAPKKRIAGLAWNGRVTGMSLQEYRERKWSVDACYAKVERRGASFSMRTQLPSHLGKKTGHQDLFLDVLRSYNSTLTSVPSYSCALQHHPVNSHAVPGPGEYNINSCMDPNKHPSIPKHTGPRFGSEVLNPKDPTGPAPGDYDPGAIVHSSTIKKMPTPVIQGREAWRPRTEAPGPGVGEYKYEQAMRTGKLTPLQYSISRRNDPLPDGPCKFGCCKGLRAQDIGPGAPHYFRCIGCCDKDQKEQPVPGSIWHPTKLNYNPTKHKAPIWKFGSEPRGLRN